MPSGYIFPYTPLGRYTGVCVYLIISLFSRTKIQEGGKNIEEVLNWYKEVNAQTLKYVTYSIHDSDISDFYRLIILRILILKLNATLFI